VHGVGRMIALFMQIDSEEETMWEEKEDRATQDCLQLVDRVLALNRRRICLLEDPVAKLRAFSFACLQAVKWI
jgi:hypothetical protein